MKNFLIGLCILTTPVLGDSQDIGRQNTSISKSDSGVSKISLDDLRYGTEIIGEILIFDSSGTRLLGKAPETRKWKFGNEKPIFSYWSSERKGLPKIALEHRWQMDENGVLKADIKQYDRLDAGKKGGEVQAGKLLREESFTIENLTPITWTVAQEKDRRIVVQFSVVYWGNVDAQDIGALPINSNRMTVFDNKGHVWAARLDNSDGDNIYFGITTHQGSVFLSYLPFKGSKKIGVAEKNRIRVEDKDLRLSIESGEPFLPRGVIANVYGYFDLNKRTDRMNSVKSNGSDREDRFLAAIK